MDKHFLLTYTKTGTDDYRHSYHAWFEREDALKAFVKTCGDDIETDLAIEILSFRKVEIEER